MLVVDRPWPVKHEYKSILFIVDFEWGAPDDQMPIYGRVEIETEPSQRHSFYPSTSWNSLDEARDDVITQTKKFIDARHPVAFLAANR